MSRIQGQRLAWRLGFFALFLLAPPLDIFRLDLTLGHFVVFGQAWTLAIDPADGRHAELNILVRVFLPVVLIIAVAIGVAWRYGRLYCGWLCPHFSVVELINALMRRALGKPTLWEREVLPQRQDDGVRIQPRRFMWWLVVLAVLFFSLLWAVTLLTYLLPPAQVWRHLLDADLSRNQWLFIAVASGLLVLEFSLARHLFCRFGCAVGLFQSLVWMANRRALVVGFDRTRARACVACDRSCEHACPMRLKPRQIKRKIFTCTQCRRCVQACERVSRPGPGLLQMLSGDCARAASEHDFGRRPELPTGCFTAERRPGPVTGSAGQGAMD